MPILQGDIKLVKSQVMDDVPEGGGAPSGELIRDGQSNAIFPDISEVARAGGKVSVVKVFAHVQTGDTDSYLDGNVIVAEPPQDPNVSVTLMSTGDTFDRRTAAQNRIESYLVPGPEWPGFLLENHVTGQRVIQIFQRPGEAPPNAGETLVLVWSEDSPALKREQYVRVTKTSTVTRTYTSDSGREYSAAVVSCELSDPLRFDLPGTAPNEYFRRASAATRVRQSTVANAARYAGVARLTDAVAVGDLACRVDTVFTRLVPSAQTEIPLVALDVAGQSVALTASSAGTISYTTQLPFNSTTGLNVGNAITPGTLVITAGTARLTDSGGQLFDGATAVGVVDYARGTVTFAALAAPYTGGKTVAFQPAAAPSRVANTGMIAVTQESRAYNYILTIVPAPAPGSVRVSYRAQGRWYDLYDDGSGRLAGQDASYGTGTVLYADGTTSVTLGALPDVGSAVMFWWGASAQSFQVGGSIPAPGLPLQLANLPVKPGSLAVRWRDAAGECVAHDDGLGKLTGDGAGSVDYLLGLVNLIPRQLLRAGEPLAVTYESMDGGADAGAHSLTVEGPPRRAGGAIALDLGQRNVIAGSVRLDWTARLVSAEQTSQTGKVSHLSFPGHISARDQGDGTCEDDLGHTVAQVDYDQGLLTLYPDQSVVAMTEVTYRAASVPNVAGPTIAEYIAKLYPCIPVRIRGKSA